MLPPVAALDPLIQNLINGDLIGFVISCYTSVMGQTFYGFVMFIMFMVVYNKTRSLALISILWLLLGGIFIVSVAEFSPIAMVLVAFGLTGIVYKVFGKR